MSSQTSEKRPARDAILSSPRWKGARSLELVYQLNDRCLELLSRVAASPEGQCPLALVNLNADLWPRLEASARRRAARFPFVIVDVHFADSIWWHHARSASTESRADMRATKCFPKEIAEHLMNESLMFVWHAAQSDRRVACLTVGRSPNVSTIVARLSAHELRDIATRHTVRSAHAGRNRRSFGENCWWPPRATMRRSWLTFTCTPNSLWVAGFLRIPDRFGVRAPGSWNRTHE